jgi:hypothetical protein
MKNISLIKSIFYLSLLITLVSFPLISVKLISSPIVADEALEPGDGGSDNGDGDNGDSGDEEPECPEGYEYSANTEECYKNYQVHYTAPAVNTPHLVTHNLDEIVEKEDVYIEFWREDDYVDIIVDDDYDLSESNINSFNITITIENLDEGSTIEGLEAHLSIILTANPVWPNGSGGGSGGGGGSIVQPGDPDTWADIHLIVRRIITSMLVISGVVAVLVIIFGGYNYIVAGGDLEKASKGKNAVIGAVVGLIIVAAAYAIIEFIYRYYV